MSDEDETVVDFSTAKSPHVYARTEDKVKALRKRFREARNEVRREKAPAKGKKTNKRKKRKSKKK